MPTSVKVSIGVLAALGVLLLLSSLVTAAAFDRVVDAVADAQPDSPRSDAEATVQVNLAQDRKSTRLNSSHANISYAVFCLKKKKIMTSIQLHVLRCRSVR